MKRPQAVAPRELASRAITVRYGAAGGGIQGGREEPATLFEQLFRPRFRKLLL